MSDQKVSTPPNNKCEITEEAIKKINGLHDFQKCYNQEYLKYMTMSDVTGINYMYIHADIINRCSKFLE